MSEKKTADKQSQLYQCPACGLHYKSEEVKDSCKSWCEKYNSCNLEIIKYSEESKQQSEKQK